MIPLSNIKLFLNFQHGPALLIWIATALPLLWGLLVYPSSLSNVKNLKKYHFYLGLGVMVNHTWTRLFGLRDNMLRCCRYVLLKYISLSGGCGRYGCYIQAVSSGRLYLLSVRILVSCLVLKDTSDIFKGRGKHWSLCRCTSHKRKKERWLNVKV